MKPDKHGNTTLAQKLAHWLVFGRTEKPAAPPAAPIAQMMAGGIPESLKPLWQGLARGRIDGDEMRLICDQLPRLADAMCAGMAAGPFGNVTPARLVELADMGVMTLPTIERALR